MCLTQLKPLWRRNKSSTLTHFDIYPILISLMISLRSHFLQNHWWTNTMLFQTDLRLNVNTHKARKLKKTFEHCRNHTLHVCTQAHTHWGLVHFLSREKQEHYSCPGSHYFLSLPLTTGPKRLGSNFHYRNWNIELGSRPVILIL